MLEQKLFSDGLGVVDYSQTVNKPASRSTRSSSSQATWLQPTTTVRTNTGQEVSVGQTHRNTGGNSALPTTTKSQQAGYGIGGFLTNPLVITLIVGGVIVTQIMRNKEKGKKKK